METTDHKHGNRLQHTHNMPDSLYFTLRCLKLESYMIKRSSGQLGVVKCAVAHKIVIPENSTLIVDGHLDNKYYSNVNLVSFSLFRSLYFLMVFVLPQL